MSTVVETAAFDDHLHRLLRKRVDAATYNLWLAGVTVNECPDGALELVAPTHARPWVQARFGATLLDCVRELFGRPARLQSLDCTQPAEHPGPTATSLAADPGLEQRAGTSSSPASGLAGGALHSLESSDVLASQQPNPTLTFGRFVIGESNRLAHSAALTASEVPGGAYNPLLIYGPSGCGKTHLLHAIAAVATFSCSASKLLLTSGEAFTAAFLSALQRRSTVQFKSAVRSVHTLLIDDVAFIAGKRRTEDELLHAFNSITERGGQVIFTFDRPPESIAWASTCLRERLRSGLAVEIEQPDLRLREMVVRRTLLEHGLELRDSALVDRLALGVSDSVRSLQSALMRSLAYASLRGEELSSAAVDSVLRAFYGDPKPSGEPHFSEPRIAPSSRRPTTIAEVQALTASHFNVDVDELISRRRSRALTWPRQVAMYLARVQLGAPLQSIGRAFDDRDHATVIHACKRVRDRIAADQSAREQLESILTTAGSASNPHPININDRS